MFAVTGITGKVGGAVARALLAAGQPVRAVVRDAGKGTAWEQLGCEIAIADSNDAAALTAAIRGAEGVFLMAPPIFDPASDLAEAHAVAAAFLTALEAAQPAKAVYLSSIGADAREFNLLTQHTIIEQGLRDVDTPLTFLRPAWFMENASFDVAPATAGVIPSFLQPLDKPVPMVATCDVGRIAAELLQESWSDHRIVNLEGPQRVTPNQLAETFAKLLGRPVTAEAVPREAWESIFRSHGMTNPLPRMRMVDGFNEGWIEFDGDSLKGEVSLETVLQGLIPGES